MVQYMQINEHNKDVNMMNNNYMVISTDAKMCSQ